jgi:outer membrane receptor protein involved in Fe transport
MKKILLIAFLISSVCLFAQQRQGQYSGGGQAMPTEGKIKGLVVTGTDNKPLEYASVGIYRASDSTLVTGSLTDSKGMFTVENLPFGKFYVEVNYVGFKKSRVNNILLTPKSKDANIGNISVIESTTKISEVEVVGTRTQVEYKLDKKIVNVSSNLTASGGTAVDALQNVPSVQTDVDGNVTLRGSGNFQVLIDGKPSVLQGTEALQQIPAGTIENIEIITNPSAKYDADGVAGIINVVMKKQKFAGVSGIVNGSVASVPQYSTDFLLSYRTNKLNVFLGADWNDSQNPGSMKINKQTYNLDTIRNHMDTTYQNTNANNVFTRKGYGVKGGIDLKITDNNSLSVNAAYGNREFDRRSDTRYHRYLLNVPAAYDSTYLQTTQGKGSRTYYNVNADYRHTFDDKGHELSASIYYANGKNDNINDLWLQSTDADYQNPAASYIITRTASNSAQGDLRSKADYVHPFSEKSKLELGYQGRYTTTLDTFYTQIGHADGVYGIQLDQEVIHFLDNVQAFYGTYSNSLEFIDFQLGLRTEYNYRTLSSSLAATTYKINRLDFFPTVHLSKQLANEQQVQLSYSRRVQRPDERQLDPYKQWFDAYSYMIGNPNLKPQYTDSYELNFQKRFATGFWSAEAYYRQTNGLMERGAFKENGDTMRMTSINVGKDGSLGIELMANLDVYKWWNLNVTATGFYYQIIGSIPAVGKIPEQNLNSNTYTGNIRMNSVFKLPWGTRLQFTAMYNAPSIEPQGTEGHMFMTGFALRRDFMKRKLSATLQMRDIFNTMKRTGTGFGPGFYDTSEFHRNGQILVLTLSYKFNNFKQDRKQEDVNQRDFGGEDMMQ